MGWKQLNKESTGAMIFFLGSAQMTSNVIRIISGLIIAKLLLPETLGLFNGFGIIIGYLPILQFGIMNGLNRELPYLFGKSEHARAKKIASVAQFWELILACISFSILFILSIVKLFHGNYLYFAGYLTYAFTAFHFFYSTNYLQILFRTNRDFNKLSIIALIVSASSLVLIIPVWKWGFYGLGLRLVLISAIEFILLYKYKPLTVKPLWDKSIFIEIFKVGIPIFIVGYVFALWGVLQNTIIFKFGGSQQFGYFSLAIMVEASLTVLIGAINQVIYPKLSFEYGKGTSLNTLLKITLKPVIIVFAILVPSVILMWFAMPIVVKWWLPQYINGIAAAQWTLITLFVSVLGSFNLIFNVVKKQKDYLISIAVGIAAFTFVLYLLYLNKGFNLVIFPQAMFIGKLVQIITAFFYLKGYRNTHNKTKVHVIG